MITQALRKYKKSALLSILMAGTVAVAAFPGIGEGASQTITAVYVPGATALDPADPAWNVAPVVTLDGKHIDYVDTGCGLSKISEYEKRTLRVRAVHNGPDIFFRFEWDDPSADTVVNDPDLFADAVALQIPFREGGNTDVKMGTQNTPVNIIMWRADLPRPQNAVGGGIGTVQTSPDPESQNIVRSQNWSNGVWTVIVSRPMVAASDNQVTFSRGDRRSIAFGNWEGSDWERDGHKNIYRWQDLYIQ